MNKNLFKVIFNKKRGQMMAVAENTIREGKSTADSTAGSAAIMNSTIKIAGLPVLAWSILLGFGLCTLVIDSSLAGSINADTSAPKNQQPTILQTANGTPQINIRTPTKGGVSINQFRQMDVDNKGAILNNSRKNTATRLAGWIQANPWLSKGEARVIVNQINSTNPSQLNGYIEVAGRRAEVIIANPAGINVNGSGFINAAGVTLTTGKPLIKNGNLDGFEVRQGNISIGGDGLDTGSSEYTRILSQAAQINAGIWANNLNITAGSNNTDVQGNITESVLTSAENKPLVAIDAGKLGGMYAGKIVLVSTDKGVGVNNAGQIYAGNGNLSIDANGYLSNSGSIVVSDQKSSGADIASVSLNADRVTNSGTVSSQGKMLVHSEQLENSGLLTTADEINIRQQKLHNQGEINAGRIDIIADNIHNQNGKIIQTGTQGLALDMNKLDNRNNGLIGYAPEKDKPAPSVPEHKPEPVESVTPPTTAAGSGQTVTAVNPHKTQFETGQIIGNQEIINDNGQIIANGGIDITSKTGLNNHGSLNLNKLTVNGEIFDNYQGKLNARQVLINTNSIDNHQGEITTTESLSAKSGKLNNRKGKLQSVKDINIDSAQLDNSDNGLIAAQEQLSIQSKDINNSLDGKIQSGASLKLSTNNLNNRQGSIDSNSLILKANIVDNSKGAIRTNRQLKAQIGNSLNNQGGEFGSGEDILLNSEGEGRLIVDNSDGGKIIANKNAYLNTESIKNNNKGIISSENLDLKAARAENTAGGVIQAGKQLKAQIDEKLDNTGGNIVSNEELLLNADGQSNLVLNNSANGKIQAGKHAVIHTTTLDNSNNGSIDAESIDLTANSVNNAAGAIRANQQLKVQIGNSLNNQGGEFGSGGDVLLNSEGESHLAVDNSDGGKIIAGKYAYLNTESIKNNNKGIISSENLYLKAARAENTAGGIIQAGKQLTAQIDEKLDNTGGNIVSNEELLLNADGSGNLVLNNSANGKIQAGKHAVIHASTLDNSSNGSIDADRIDLIADSVNNAAGAIRTNRQLKAQIGSSLNNQGGEFGSGGDVLLNSEGESHLTVDNSNGGKIIAGKDAYLNTESIKNNNKGIISSENLHLKASVSLNNSTNGVIQSGKEAVIQASTLDNSNNGSIDADSIDLTADSVNNAAGAIRTNQQLKAQISNSLNNQGGEFGSGGDVLLNSEGESHLAVDNSEGGKIIAGKDAYLNTESIKNNNKGIISSENLNLKAARAENTAGGIIQAGKQLKAQIDEKLDNTGGNIASNEELLLNVDGLSNLVLNNSANGKIQAGKGVVIHASTLDNSNNGSIDADSIDLTADSIDNTAGNIRANKQLNAQINQKLLNQYGQISSADNVNIHDQLHNTLEIDNTNNGKILAGNDLNLQAKKLDYASTDDAGIAAGHDASIDLTDDFNINGNISANAGLKLHSNGKIINNHNVTGDSVIIDASRIDNQSAGTIQSNKHTELNVQDSVINRGLINSNGLTLIQAGNLVDNVGTGRIYGDHVAIGTGSLLNREETTGNETKAAIIAARQQLNIGARDIVNKEQGYLLSEGNLAIGGKLDEQYHATGMADSLINSSARIEAKGNGNIAVNELRNLNNHFTLEEYLANPEQHIQQYLFPGQTEKWTEGVDGHYNERKKKNEHSEFYFNDGRPMAREGKTGITWWDFNRNTYKQRVSESRPGEIIIGGNLNISGSHWENNNSRILVGGSLIGADSLQLDNIESKGQQRVVDTGTLGGYKKSKSGSWPNRRTEYKRKVRGQINETTITTIDLEQPVSIIQQHTKVDSTDNTIIGVNNNTGNIENAGSVYTGSSSIGSSNSKHTDTVNVTSNNSVKDNVNADKTGSNDYNMSANNQPVDDNKTDSAKVPSIKTLTSLNNKLPNNSLYHIDPDNKGYLVETDPAFTNKNKWLSSNYMLEALGQDPEKIQKRLGDGYYEQRLINEQIDQLTGYRRLAGYDSDEDEYKALMDAGVSMAKTMGLVPGIALSADQVARLTSDIVWMVSQTVTMPDGSQQTVLVPQVYLMVRDGDLNTAGALISANNISLHTNKDINNQGTVAGRRIVDLGAHNLSNSGLISGQNVLLNATDNIDINGGTVQAQNFLGLQAKHINVNTTTATHGDERNGGTVIDRVAGLYVTGSKNGILAVNSVEDLNFHGANIVNTATNGLTQLASSNGSVNLGTVQTASHTGYGELSARNHLALDHKDERGTQVIAGGDVTLFSGNTVNIRQSDINSTNGDINIYGNKGVNIIEGRAKTDLDEAHYNKTRGTFSTKKSIDKYQKHNDEAVSSNITGSNIRIGSEQDINIRGSNVIADNQTLLHAGRDINIEAAENQYQVQEYHARKKSGLMGSGGFGFSIGSQKQTDDIAGNSLIHSGSNVGSLKGDTIIVAGNRYTQSGSTVSSPGGNVAVVAKQINVQAAQDQYSTDYVHTMKQSGITVGVNIPVVGAIQKAGTAIERTNKSKNDRINAMAAFNAGMDTYKAGSAVADIANNPQNAMNASVGITVGQQKLRMESHTKDTVASASRINAGGTVNLLATGAGKDSNINIIGSDVAGSRGTHLQADNEINLLAAEQSHSERSSNKSSGWNAGVAISYGSGGASLGVTAGGNLGKGHGNGDETSYRNSHVGSSSGSTSLSSGGATNIIGAQVIGKGVSIDAAELNIASLQDKAKYDSKQQNISGQVTVGYGASGSASYSKSKIKADYAGVTEQSGIIAGDDGYQIKVKGSTDLKGAIITSASAAEAAGKNSLITGSLTSSDIKNHSDYSGNSIGIDVSGSISASKPERSQSDKKDNTNNKDSNNNNTDSDKKWSDSNHTSLGLGHDSDHDSSTTHSGINTSNIIITDETAQQQKTGKTVAEAIAAIHTDTSSEDYAGKAGYLTNNFDKEKVLNELNIQVEVTKEFRQNSLGLINSYIDSRQAELRKKIKEETSEENKTELYKEIYKLQYQRRLLETVVNILAADPTAAITQGTLQLAATKLREESLANSRKSPGIVINKETGEVMNNVSYDSGYFDGVKLGGVRLHLDIICGSDNGRCETDDMNNLKKDEHGNYIFKGDSKYPTFADLMKDTTEVGGMFGLTGGFQPVQGGWYLPGLTIPYNKGDFSDDLIESFAGTHDYLGGQIWGWYGDDGNTSRNRNPFQNIASDTTTYVAIPASAPAALADFLNSDMFQLLYKLGK